MVTQAVDVLIEGGKATAAPPLGPALGPLGVNIGLVVAEINKKTVDFKGMQVPVKVTVDKETKTFTISIGTPPASGLIKKEAGVESGANNAKLEKVADLRMQQIIKIAKMKQDALLGKDMKQKVKEIVGTCQSMGIMVEGKPAHDTIDDINKGKFDDLIKSGKTELSADELKVLAEEKQRLQEEIKKKREKYLKQAQDIKAQLTGKETREIRKAMSAAGIPDEIVNEVAPEEKKK